MPQKYLYEPGCAQIPAPSANIPSGTIINHAVLGACLVEGLNARNATGEPIHVRYKGIAEVRSASATTFAAGVTVEILAGLAVANATAGAFDIGRAVIAKTSGQTSVMIELNEYTPAPPE